MGCQADPVCTRIDWCAQAQLEFKDDRIRKFETIVNAPGPSATTSSYTTTAALEPMRLQVAKTCQTLEQSHSVIRVLFDMLVSSRREVRAVG